MFPITANPQYELLTESGEFTSADPEAVGDPIEMAKKIIPIVKINAQTIGDGKPGTVTSALYQKFMELEKSFSHLVSR